MESVQSTLVQASPDLLFHCGAVVPIPRIAANPLPAFQTNVLGTLHLLEAVRTVGKGIRVIVVGSSEEYGRNVGAPLAEDSPTFPSNLYGISKLASSLTALHYAHAYHADVVVGRVFSFTGPDQSPPYACPTFAEQIVRIERESGGVLQTGNLDAVRDYLDVRDVADALALLAERGVGGQIYNICSGQQVAMADIVQMLVEHSKRQVVHEIDPARLRPLGVPVLVGDCAKIRGLGFAARYRLRDTLKELLDFWRRKIAQ